ncbi:Ankyrin repeat-containing domain protein [Mycena sanguinolenta]|uniref:Ankyrin repeat-containing domain protein n=1 Tax=Mycena sanguinolenta TaxID=230812 RepID=A0A8H7CTD9_9AGAR|nr:Ankyrin repeat-containing domain protein [Mycena sanguinolenta]
MPLYSADQVRPPGFCHFSFFLITMKDPKRVLDWIHRKKSSAKSSAPAAALLTDDTPTKSEDESECVINGFTLVLDLAKQAFDIAEIAPFIKPVPALLQKIVEALGHNTADSEPESESVEIRARRKRKTGVERETAGEKPKKSVVMDSYKEWKDVDEKRLLVQRVVDLTVQHKAIKELKHELELLGMRLMTNRLVQLCLNRTPNTQTQDKIHNIVYNPHGTIQAPVIIHGGTGGPGGDGDTLGGAGGIGGGPSVNFTSMSVISATEEKLAKWLQSPPEMAEKQHDTEQLQSKGTGQWFLNDKRFIEWADNPGVLWVEGPSGAGKSVISSMVINNLFAHQAEFAAAHLLAVGFFYFDFRNRETQSVEIALRRIVLQLSAQALDPYRTLDEHWGLSKGQKLPSYQDLLLLLFKLLHELGRTYIVFDALDECNSSNF